MNDLTEQTMYDFGFVDENDSLTPKGEVVLTNLLGKISLYKKRMTLDLFLALMSRNVPACVELVIIQNGSVLLTYREDKYFVGYHTPGTYIAPGEDWQKTIQRCADQELKCRLHFVRLLTAFSNYDSVRFHDISCLVLCEITDGEPQDGEWFRECPPNMIPEHRKFWPWIEKCLKQ